MICDNAKLTAMELISRKKRSLHQLTLILVTQIVSVALAVKTEGKASVNVFREFSISTKYRNNVSAFYDHSPSSQQKQVHITTHDTIGRSRRQSLFENPCRAYGTCDSNYGKSFPVCYCDKECSILNDCCFDVTLPGKREHHALNKRLSYVKCVTGVVITKYRDNFGVYMISKCPESFSLGDVSNECLRSSNFLPVTASDDTTFANVYCAFCHNVSDYKVWSMEFIFSGKCYSKNEEMSFMETKNVPKKIAYIQKNCKHRFIPSPTIQIRGCSNLKVIQSNNSEMDDLCSGFVNPVNVGIKGTEKQLYRNVYCYPDFSEGMETQCISHDVNYLSTKGYGSIALTGIFNIRPAVKVLDKTICNGDEIYDVSLNVCVPRICEPGKADACGLELIRNFELELPQKPMFITNATIDRDLILRVLTVYFLSLPTTWYGLVFQRFLGESHCGMRVDQVHFFCCKLEGYISFKIKSEQTPQQISKFKSDVVDMEWTYNEVRNKTYYSVFHTKELNNDRERHAMCNLTGIKKTGYRIFTSDIKNIEEIIVFPNSTRSEIRVPTSFEAIAVLQEDDSERTQIRFEKWDLRYEENSTKNFTGKQDRELETLWKVDTIMTYVTLGTSCLALIVTMCVYRYLGLTRFPAGILSENMMGTLLAAQFIFIFGVGAEYVKVVCYAIGIIAHYIWLSAFAWMSGFLVHVLNTMRKLYTCPGSRKVKLSKSVYIFGYGLPFLLVFPSVMLDIFTEIRIGYSGNICFPTAFPANFFVFTLPVIILLTTNIVALIVTVVAISKFNSTVMLSDSIRNIRSSVPIYFRLSILCACPWLIGILADILDSDVLRYTYILLAGSHGTIVCICFLTGEAVRSGCRRIQRLKKQKKSKDGNVSKTTGDDQEMEEIPHIERNEQDLTSQTLETSGSVNVG